MPLTRSAAKRAQESEALRLSIHRQDTIVTICPSATGQGTHTRWVRPSPAAATAEFGLNLSPELSSTSSLSSIEYVDARFVTPAPQESFDAGSVIRTPVKKLAHNPDRIGPERIDFWHNKDSEFKAFITDSGRAAVPHAGLHPMAGQEEYNGSPHARIAREGNGRGLGPEGTILNIEELGSPFQSKSDVFGNNPPHLGPEGTELLDVYGAFRHPKSSHWHAKADESGTEGTPSTRVSAVRRRLRLGPHGTEIIEMA